VAGYLKKRAPEIEAPETAASYFLDMMRGRRQYRALADDTYRLSDAEITEHVRAGVRFWLNGAQPRGA
jgi:hypothetical protein